jgi:hypothetical protein
MHNNRYTSMAVAVFLCFPLISELHFPFLIFIFNMSFSAALPFRNFFFLFSYSLSICLSLLPFHFGTSLSFPHIHFQYVFLCCPSHVGTSLSFALIHFQYLRNPSRFDFGACLSQRIMTARQRQQRLGDFLLLSGYAFEYTALPFSRLPYIRLEKRG